MARICIVRQNYYPYAMDYHVQRDAQSLVQDGHEVDVVCLRAKGQPAVETVDGVRVYRLPVRKARGGIARYLFGYGAFFVLAFLALTFLMIRRRYRAVEVDTMPDALVFAALMPKLMGAKVVLYLFECMPELFMDTYGVSAKHPGVRLLKAIEKRASRFADHVVYCGPGYRSIQEPRAGKRLASSVVLNVPDTALFRSEHALQTSDSRDGSDFVVVTHGSLLEKYGVQTLVRAAPLLKDRIPGLRVLIAGEGEYREELERLSREVGADDVVTFVGMLPAQEVPRFIQQADVGVVTILHGYMLPTKLFEYFAMRRPVVSSDIPFIREFCDGDEVLFFPAGNHRKLADRLAYLYEHPEEREALVRRADQLYHECQWPVMKERYLGVYRRLGLTPSRQPALVQEPVGTAEH